MGLRDRVLGILGRERAGRPASEPAAPAVRPALRSVAPRPARPAPAPVDTPPSGALIVASSPHGAHRVVVDARAFAAELRPGAVIVVVDADPERAAGLAERLSALGVDAAWSAA